MDTWLVDSPRSQVIWQIYTNVIPLLFLSPLQGSPNPVCDSWHCKHPKRESSKVPSTLKANSAEQPLDKEMGTWLHESGVKHLRWHETRTSQKLCLFEGMVCYWCGRIGVSACQHLGREGMKALKARQHWHFCFPYVTLAARVLDVFIAIYCIAITIQTGKWFGNEIEKEMVRKPQVINMEETHL